MKLIVILGAIGMVTIIVCAVIVIARMAGWIE